MKKFSRTIENFTCLHCGARVRGGGYTNHCPQCLWSRDVDINPGDRASQCLGMMPPVGCDVRSREYIITHKCEKCGKIRHQRSDEHDNIDEIIRLSQNPMFLYGGTKS